jgi:hypothetical protein
MPRPKRPKAIQADTQIKEVPSQAAQSSGESPTTSPATIETRAATIPADAATENSAVSAQDAAAIKSKAARGRPAARPDHRVPIADGTSGGTPKPEKLNLDAPDMRAVGTWVIRHLESPDHLYPPPDPMAVTLLAACANDPKFKASFIAKVFDRMMVQDQSVSQNKFSDDNRELRELMDAIDLSARASR